MDDKLLMEIFSRVLAIEERLNNLERDFQHFNDEVKNTDEIIEFKGKYRYLSDYLENSQLNVVELTFSKIEEILNDKLPNSARLHRAMWANTETHSFALSWINAGYKVVDIDIEKEEVKYEKVRFGMKGVYNNFTIKMGESPYLEKAIRELKVYKGGIYPLVYDNDVCVGVVFEHNETSRYSPANGQAEICFFDDFTEEYGKWHRMFIFDSKSKERILYSDFIKDLTLNNIYYYKAKIKA